MDKQQGLYKMWSSFGLPAYDEQSTPDNAELPYITYQVIIGDIDGPVFPSASLWYRDDDWEDIDNKLRQISETLETLQPIPVDGGYIHVTKGSPFAQRLTDPSDSSVKRYTINLAIEFLTQY